MRNQYQPYDDDDENDLDFEQQEDSKAEAKNIIKAFIRTENDAEQIKSRHQNKKPVLFSESAAAQKRQQGTSSIQSELDNDMQLAFELINRRKEISKKLNSSSSQSSNSYSLPPQPPRTDDSILFNMEMRHAKVQQMKEERLKSKQPPQNEFKRQPSPSKPPSTFSQQKLNSSFSSQQSRGSAQKDNSKFELEEPTITPPSSEILALKAKRQFLEQQSKKMEQDMKVLKENLRKEMVQDSGFVGQSSQPTSTNASFASSKISSAIESLQREAEESRMKYNHYRLSKLIKAFNYVQKRQRKVVQKTFFESLRKIHQKYEKIINQVQAKMNSNRKRSALLALQEFVISRKDKQDERFYFEQKQNENEFLNRALDYFRFRTLVKHLRFWKKFVKIQRDERLIDEEKSVLKVKLKGFIQNLKQTITTSEKTSKELKQLQKQQIIQEFLEANAKEEAELQQKQQVLFANQIKENPNREEESGSDNEEEIQKAPAKRTNSQSNREQQFEEQDHEVEDHHQYHRQQDTASPELFPHEQEQFNSNKYQNSAQETVRNEQQQVDSQPVRDTDQKSVASANQKVDREEKLKQIQKRTEERKRNADSIRRKHEELKKQKDEEKIKKEQEEITRERQKRQQEYEEFQQRKRDEKLKKENAEKAKQLQQEQLSAAKQHHLRSIIKYYGFLPWVKHVNEVENKVVEANQFNYVRLLRIGLNRMIEATQISKHLTELEDQSKMRKAQLHHSKQIKQKFFYAILQGADLFAQESKQYSKIHDDYIKRNVFSQWNYSLTSMRNENIEFEEQYKPIILQFRKVVLLLRYFRNWKTTTDASKNERIKDSHKQNIMSKVQTWLTEFKPSSTESQQPNIFDSNTETNNDGHAFETEDDFNASQIKRDALMKYYQKKKELQQNQSRPLSYLNKQTDQEDEFKNYMIEEDNEDSTNEVISYANISSNPLKQLFKNSEQLNHKFRPTSDL